MNHVVSKWLIQRIAAVLLMPLLLWFLLNFDNLMYLNYSQAVMFLKNKINLLILSLIFLLAFLHLKIGMGEIFEDYLHNTKINKLANFLILLISIIIPVAAISAMVIVGL